MMDWDYLRYLRALAIGGTLAKAGELLGVHQTTVLRRLDQMEDALGVRFFERNPNGLRLTPAGELAFREAERLAADLETLQRKLVGADTAPVGKVRIAAEDVMLAWLLAPVLASDVARLRGTVEHDRTGLVVRAGDRDEALRELINADAARSSSRPRSGGR